MEPKATSSNVYAVPGVGPAELAAPIIDIRPSLSLATQVLFFDNVDFLKAVFYSVML